MVPDPHPETNNLTFEVPGLNQISNKRNDQVQRFGLEINSETFLALPHQLRKIISSFIANILITLCEYQIFCQWWVRWYSSDIKQRKYSKFKCEVSLGLSILRYWPLPPTPSTAHTAFNAGILKRFINPPIGKGLYNFDVKIPAQKTFNNILRWQWSRNCRTICRCTEHICVQYWSL